MYELVQISEHDYYIDSPTKIGLVKLNDTEVVAIDSGNDKDAGKKVLKHVEANGWKLVAVYNTHSHADHIGGNRLLQDRTGCRVFAYGMEAEYTSMTVLEPRMLYGGNILQELENKFLMAQPSNAERLTAELLPKGWEIIELPGHSFDMVGFRTPDNNVFLGDSVLAETTLNKYGIGYLWDPEATINTLRAIKTLEANMFIPSHAEALSDISHLADLNIEAVEKVCDRIIDLCREKITYEELLRQVFENYGLQMNLQQYVLIGSTLKSYLAYLHRSAKVDFTFEDGLMLWQNAT